MTDTPEYISGRLTPRICWYDRRSVQCKRMYLAAQYLAVMGSVAVVVMIPEESIPRLWGAVLAALVALTVAFERMGQFGRRWHLYRLAAEMLESEKQFYLHSAGPYSAPNVEKSRLLVERTEKLLATEAGHWLGLMTEGHTEARAAQFPRS